MGKFSKLYLYIFIGVLLLLSVSASSTPQELNITTVAYYSLENVSDETGRNDGTNNGVTFVSGKLNNSGDFESGDPDDISIDGVLTTIGSDPSNSVCAWFNAESFTNAANSILASGDASDDNNYFYWTFTNYASGFRIAVITKEGVGDTYNIYGNTTLSTATWYHSCFITDGTNVALTINGVNETITLHGGTINGGTFNTIPNVDRLTIGRLDRLNPAVPYDGLIDELVIFNKSLNQTEINYLYNGSSPTFRQRYDYPQASVSPPVVNVSVNDSVESTAVVSQIGSTTINTGSFETVVSSDFNVSVNNTEIYGSYAFDVVSNNDNVLYCELLIDGVVVGSETRSNVNGVAGNSFIMTNVSSLTSGSHNQSLRCLKQSGGGVITISDLTGVGHFMVDEELNTIPIEQLIFNESVSSGASYTKIGEINITTGPKNSSNQTNVLVVESKFNYINNHASEQDLYVYAVINDSFNCSITPRTVSSGGSGSVSYDCVMSNVSYNTSYTVEFFGNGTNARYQGVAVAKSFFLSDEEIIGGVGALNGAVFNGSTDTLMFNVSGGNIHHASANVFNKVGLSILSDVDTTVEIYIKLVNSGTYTTNTFTRDFEGGKVGNLIGQDVLESIPQDDYFIELWANCGGANCEFVGGAGLGYITDVTTTVANSFIVTANSVYSNNSISTFNVSDGLTFTTNNSQVEYFTDDSLVNFTVLADNYFSKSVVNHNTSNNIQVNLSQSYIYFNAFDSISGFQLTNFTVNDSVVSGSTTNGSLMLSLDAGNYTFSFINTQGYYNNTFSFEVLALDNKTVNVSNVYNHVLTFTAFNLLTGSGINNFTIYLNDSEGFGFSESVSTTNGSALFYISTLVNYSSSIDSPNMEVRTANHSNLSGLSSSYNYTVYTTNSLNITFYDINDLSSPFNNTVIVQFLGDTAITRNTSNGTLYVDLFSPDKYTIVYDADGYEQGKYIVTVANRSYSSLTLYLTNESASLVLLTVKDKFGNVLQDVEITVQRWESDAWRTEQIIATDFQGQAEAYYILSTEYYNHVLTYNDIIYFGVINGDTNKKVIYAEDVNNGLNFNIDILGVYDLFTYQELYDVSTSLLLVNTSNESAYYRFAFDDPDNLDRTGCLNVYEGGSQTLVCSNCSTSSSAVLICNINTTSYTMFSAFGVVDDVVLEDRVDWFGVRVNGISWGVTGYIVAFIVLLLVFFVFADSPSISIIAGCVLFAVFVGVGIIFEGVSIGIMLSIFAVGVIVALVKSESGLNG